MAQESFERNVMTTKIEKIKAAQHISNLIYNIPLIQTASRPSQISHRAR